MLERTGAKTALVTTEGFRDVYEIGRINRPDAYNLYFQKHMPLIERALRFEVKERVRADGEVVTPLDEAGLAALSDKLEKLGIEAAAIMFINCYANGAHEARARELSEQAPSRHVRLGLARAVAGVPRVRALLDGRRQRLYRAEGAPLRRRDRRAHPQGRLPRLVPDRAIDRRPLRERAGADAMRAHAGSPARRPA